jgi:hypothetical protein
MSSFVYSLMGVDADEPLNHILIRKEAERKTGGNWWWGLATSNIAKELEQEATSNGGTLPVLFAAVPRPNDGVRGQKGCVWNGWQSRDGKRGGRIPDHALVKSGYDQRYFSEDPKEKKPYYALVCQSEAEVARGNFGHLAPTKYLTPSGKTRDSRQRTALLVGNPVLQPHGLSNKIELKADLVDPWYVRLTEPRVLTPAQVDEVHRYRDGDDWRSLVRRLRGE